MQTPFLMTTLHIVACTCRWGDWGLGGEGFTVRTGHR